MEKLIVNHGGYRRLKTFQISQLVFDITVRFCKKYIPIGSRTNDQMVQLRDLLFKILPKEAKLLQHLKKPN